MGRVEAAIFASPAPLPREALAKIVGKKCNLDDLLSDIRDELRARPYELVFVAGGWQLRTKARYAATRAELSRLVGKEVSRDVIGRLKSLDLIAAGPRAPEAGAPYAYVTTRKFLDVFGLASLRELPDIESLEDAGLLQRPANVADLDGVLGLDDEHAELVDEMEGDD